MIDLFGADGQAALARIARTRTLYAFDFDGTLAAIVDRPDDARASDETLRLLQRLSARVPTALLSGRGVDDLRLRLPFAPRHVVGNHGAEGLPADESDKVDDDAHAAIVTGWFAQWPAALEPGIVVERKRLSLSVHYRATADHDVARRSVQAAVERLVPAPRVIGGKCVFNLLPEGAPDKGTALAALVRLEGCAAAFFIGDDVTDEAAFVDAPAHWVTVHVGADDDSAARYRIASQADIERCLETLLAHVEGAAA